MNRRICLALLTAVSLLGGNSYAAELEIGAKAPEFKAKGVDGKEISLAEAKGAKATVIAFTCNRCPVAIAYEDRFIDFQKKYAGKDVKFIAINVNSSEDIDAMKQRVEEKGINYPYVYDKSGDSARAFGARVTPHIFVLDAEGKLAYQGSFDDKQDGPTTAHVENAVKALMQGKQPEVKSTRPFGCGIKPNKGQVVMRGSIRPAALGTLAIAIILAFVVSRSLLRQDRPRATDDQSHSLDVKLSEGDRETFAQILSRHHGQVVLVDFWATWCGPCVKQFPHTVELSHKYRDQGLAVVTVSMNEPKERDSVLAFLTRQKADVENLLPKYGAGSEFLEAFDLRGDVPFYKLYDKQGVLRYTFSDDPAGIENCEPIEKIDQRIEELLHSST